MSSGSSVDRAPTRCSRALRVRDPDFLFSLRRSGHFDKFTFHISLPSLKFYNFILLSALIYDDFKSTDPTRMQATCDIWTQLNDLALHEFS